MLCWNVGHKLMGDVFRGVGRLCCRQRRAESVRFQGVQEMRSVSLTFTVGKALRLTTQLVLSMKNINSLLDFQKSLAKRADLYLWFYAAFKCSGLFCFYCHVFQSFSLCVFFFWLPDCAQVNWGRIAAQEQAALRLLGCLLH